MCPNLLRHWRRLLLATALLHAFAWANGQLIVTHYHLTALTQLSLHLDGLESSWEVMNARAHEPSRLAQDLPPLPGDDVISRDLRLAMGPVKLDMSPRVRDFILFFTRARRSSTEAMLGMANVYAPVIERRLTELQLPAVLGFLPAALSAFHLMAASEDGHAGLWQLNHFVAARYGLACNASVDERRDLYKSTRAASSYLADLHKEYGDWSMAVLAYTCSPAAISRARLRAGATAHFDQLYPFLPEGRRDYLPAFAAITYIFTHLKPLGLSQLPMEVMPLPDRIQLQQPLQFRHVANALGIPENQLRTMNPVCRTEVIPGIGMAVQLCLPNGYGQRFAAIKDSLYKLQLRQDAEVVKPEPKPSATSAETNETPKPESPKPAVPKLYSPPAGTGALSYTIKSGDNVGLIAQWYGVNVQDLREMNRLASDRIKAGEKLVVYVPKADITRLTKVESMTFAEKQAMVGAKTPTTTPNTNTAPKLYPKPGEFTVYTVKSGDNLWLIAKKYPGVTPEAIMKLNGVNTKLQPGMQLKIPQSK